MPINDAARAPLPTSCLWQRERSVVVVYMPCFVPLPLISPPLCRCVVFLRVSPCERRVDWVQLFRSEQSPTCEKMSVGGCACPGECLQSLSFLPVSCSVSVLSGAVRKMTYIKVLQSCLWPASDCVSLCVCVCVCMDTCSCAPLSTHVLT